MNRTWFKTYRDMWEHAVWCLPAGQRCVWLTCLRQANVRAKDWDDGRERVTIPAGSFVTSQPHLAKLAKVSQKVVRGALENLERIGSIRAKVRAKRWTMIEIINWGSYQASQEDGGEAVGEVRAKRGRSEGDNLRIRELENERKEQIHCEAGAPLHGVSSNHYREQAGEILAWLNEKARRNFRSSEANLGFIIARLKDGILPGQLRAIVTRKCREWSTDEKMCKFLRPETLFGRTKCESYLGELPKIEEPTNGEMSVTGKESGQE